MASLEQGGSKRVKKHLQCISNQENDFSCHDAKYVLSVLLCVSHAVSQHDVNKAETHFFDVVDCKFPALTIISISLTLPSKFVITCPIAFRAFVAWPAETLFFQEEGLLIWVPMMDVFSEG